MNRSNTKRPVPEQSEGSARIPVKIGVLNDLTSDRENEAEVTIILREMREFLAPSHKPVLVWNAHEPKELLFRFPEADILVVDYGGLMGAYSDVLYRFSEAVQKWADEHPGRLVVLWTGYTCDIYRDVFEAEFGRNKHRFEDAGYGDGLCRCGEVEEGHSDATTLVRNIIFRYEVRGPFGAWGEIALDFEETLRAWVGVTEGAA